MSKTKEERRKDKLQCVDDTDFEDDFDYNHDFIALR